MKLIRQQQAYEIAGFLHTNISYRSAILPQSLLTAAISEALVVKFVCRANNELNFWQLIGTHEISRVHAKSGSINVARLDHGENAFRYTNS